MIISPPGIFVHDNLARFSSLAANGGKEKNGLRMETSIEDQHPSMSEAGFLFWVWDSLT
jgi:hypothetical protein